MVKRFKDTETFRNQDISTTLDDASVFPLINIIWELLLNDEGEEITISEMREISGRTELDLPVPRLGPEQSRNMVLLSRLNKDLSASRHWFCETKRSDYQGSAVLGNRRVAGACLLHRVFAAWDSSVCTFHRGRNVSALCICVGVHPTPCAGQILVVDFSLPTSCFQNCSKPHQRLTAQLPLIPTAFACAAPIAWNAILTSHPSPFTWQLVVQVLKFGSVTSSRKPSLILLPKAESQSFWKLLGRLFRAFWQYLVFIGS